MTNRPTHGPLLPLGRRPGRFARAALAGVALSALASAGALAEPAGVVRTPGALDVAIPATDLSPPPVSARDFAGAPRADATGSVETAPAPSLETAVPAPATPAPIDAASAFDPTRLALTALLADDRAIANLKIAARDRVALTAFYALRNGAPVWLEGGRFNAAAAAAKTRVAAAGDDGLDPDRYALAPAPWGADPSEVARADVALTAATLAYARDAWGGRVTPALVSPSITASTPPFDAAAALAAIAGAPDVAAVLDGFNPPHPQFRALRTLLAAKRAAEADAPRRVTIPDGPLLKPGADDARMPALRIRLGLTGADDDLYFDDALAASLTEFQRANKIAASGLLNRQTIRALNAETRRDSSALILANMERWRWMPRELGAKHVFVDIPAFELHVMQDGASTHDARVIVGKVENQTPIFSNAIDHVIVNPYWNVPVSIAVKEMLPQLRRNPAYLADRGYEVVVSDGKRARVVSAASVDWSESNLANVRIRQPPGERNALGHIKFMFPNQHAVYLHDTPTRGLFKQSQRALSHGCVRVDKPLEFADALTGDQGLSGAKLGKMVGGGERRLNLSTKIPVHLTYFTAWVDADGALQSRTDIYGQDARLGAALNGERLTAIAPPRAPKPKAAKAAPRPAAAAPQAAEPALAPAAQARVAGSSGVSPWFSNLFGGSRN